MTARPALGFLSLATSLALATAFAIPAAAQSHHPAHERSAKRAAPAEVVIPDAAPEQMTAANMVFYGRYDCEFNQKIDVAQDARHSGYVDLRFGRSSWVMKPVLSPTGAIRLEDVRGEMLVVQIAAKSMLLDVKTGHRLVDDCICPAQRQLAQAARAPS